MPRNDDPFAPDFDGDDFGSFAPKKATSVGAVSSRDSAAKPKPKASALDNDDLAGMGGDGDFWGSKKSVGQNRATEGVPTVGAPSAPVVQKSPDISQNIGVGAPTKNAFSGRTSFTSSATDQSAGAPIDPETGLRTPNIPIDTAVSNGYWGAVFAYTCMQDVEVVVDAPVGCYSLPATATINYTDALPELENLASSNITEIEVSLDGTTRKVLDAVRRVKARESAGGRHKQVIVISSQESELIGADHVMSLSKKHPDAIYFTSHSFEEDEWKSRDTCLTWLYKTRKERIADGFDTATPPTDAPADIKRRWVNIIGPTYSCFNSYADFAELKRLIEGVGGIVHYVFPFKAAYSDMDMLDESATNVVMYREFGEGLAKELGKSYQFAPFGIKETTDFLLELGRNLGREDEAKAFIKREKRETLAPVWDIWQGAPQDFFSTTKIAIVANESYAQGLSRFLGDELGMQIGTVVSRQRSNDMGNYALRDKLAKERPTIVMGSLNERIYLAEAGMMARFIPASLPIPFITRATGTPFMGYQGALYLVQIITNTLFDVLFDVLPRERRQSSADRAAPHSTSSVGAPSVARTPSFGQGVGAQPAMPSSATLDSTSNGLKWADDAKALFDRMIEMAPMIARISASDKLRVASISAAKDRGVETVEQADVMKALPSVMM